MQHSSQDVCWCSRWERGVLGCLIPLTKIPVWNFVNSTCPMERYIPVAQTQPKPQHVIALVSRIQKSGTRDNHFVKWRGTFWFDRPKWPDRSKWTTFKAGHEYFGQTKPKSTIPFDQPTEISGILGWMEIKSLWTPLWRILRFTLRLHTAYLPNYFQLFLLKFCHTLLTNLCFVGSLLCSNSRLSLIRGVGTGFVLVCGNSGGVGSQFLINMENPGRWGVLSKIPSVVGYG